MLHIYIFIGYLLSLYIDDGYSELVASVVIPHGDFAALPDLVPDVGGRCAAKRVHDAVLEAASMVKQASPEIIVLVTPHGQAVSEELVVYLNSAGAGFADLGQDLHNTSASKTRINVNATLDVSFARDLLQSSACEKFCTGLQSFGDAEPQPLRWGEVIPLALLNSTLSKVVVLSLPSSRYKSSAELTRPYQIFGSNLANFFAQRQEKIALLLSSDLAHTHLASGPYGYSPTAKPFDEAIGKWALNPIEHASSLLVDAKGLVDRALSCGYLSLVIIHGVLHSSELGRSNWISRVLALEAPTYYGMLVAYFDRKPFQRLSSPHSSDTY